MDPISVFLIMTAIGFYLMPTIKIYSTLKKYDDKTPGFFVMQIKIATYLKKYERLNKIQHGKGSSICKFWYVGLMTAIFLIATACII